jgi:hypothetical protein
MSKCQKGSVRQSSSKKAEPLANPCDHHTSKTPLLLKMHAITHRSLAFAQRRVSAAVRTQMMPFTSQSKNGATMASELRSTGKMCLLMAVVGGGFYGLGFSREQQLKLAGST